MVRSWTQSFLHVGQAVPAPDREGETGPRSVSPFVCRPIIKGGFFKHQIVCSDQGQAKELLGGTPLAEMILTI